MTKKWISSHDHSVRSLTTKQKIIREFFYQNLPEGVKGRIEFPSTDESFVGDKSSRQIAKLLYPVKANGKQGVLSVVLERASTPNEVMPCRKLKHVIAALEYLLK